jgi:hypothetical protein
MKKTIIGNLLFSLIVLTCGCEKNKEPETVNAHFINIPESLDIDINNDAITDFRIEYKELVTNDYPSSGLSMIGFLHSLNENEIVYKPFIGNLFLQQNDIIYSSEVTAAIWSRNPADLISHNGHDSAWRILSPYFLNDLFIGFKLKASAKIYIGWMKLDIDKKTGNISLLNWKLTEGDFIIIQE